jgi:hypothetical protein
MRLTAWEIQCNMINQLPNRGFEFIAAAAGILEQDLQELFKDPQHSN